jgi:hypothetical protein
MENKLRFLIIPVYYSVEWWAAILDYHTALEGPTIAFAERYSEGLDRLLLRTMGNDYSLLYRYIQIFCRFFRRIINRYSPEQLRDEIVHFVRERDLTQGIQVARASIQYEQELGIPIAEEDREFLGLSIDEAKCKAKTIGIPKLENLPVDIWQQVKDMIIDGINLVYEGDAKLVVSKMREMDLLRWITWYAQVTPKYISYDNPQQWFSETNTAMVKQVEYWLGISDDSEGGLSILWDLGVRAEGKYVPWDEMRAKISSRNIKPDVYDKLRAPIEHVMDVLADCVQKHPAVIILGWGENDYLIKRLNIATWNDRKDRLRKNKQKKVIAPENLSVLEDLLKRKAKNPPELTKNDIDDIDSIDFRIVIDQLLRNEKLTPTEKAFLIKVRRIVDQEGYSPSYRDLGARLGISGARAYQIMKSIAKKASELES